MKKLLIVLLIVLSVGILSLRYFKKSKQPEQNSVKPAQQQSQNQVEAQTPTTTPSSGSTASSSPTTINGKPIQYYTMAEVAKHGSDTEDYTSCWTVIHDKVYDITKYADSLKHPGGEQIYQACGIDATELFENRPGVGTPHPESARKILGKYYIGELKK